MLNLRRSLITCMIFSLVALLAAGCGGPSESLSDSQERQEVQMKFEHGEKDAGMDSKDKEDADKEMTSTDGMDSSQEADGAKAGGTDEEAAEVVALSAADLEQAKGLFTTSCGGCHALSDAGTNGAAGPGLDNTKLSAAEIESQIINGMGAMPGGLLTGDDATLVANYVAQVTAK
jgi:mono/diheme cytochrome c family protein